MLHIKIQPPGVVAGADHKGKAHSHRVLTRIFAKERPLGLALALGIPEIRPAAPAQRSEPPAKKSASQAPGRRAYTAVDETITYRPQCSASSAARPSFEQ